MSEDKGYFGNALDCLKKNNIKVGDSIKITADLTYSGILMPRYESGDDKHLVLKLGNGYNVGINVDEIQKIQVVSSSEVKPEQSEERKEDSKLPKILLLSTGGTIASKVDYRTGAVTRLQGDTNCAWNRHHALHVFFFVFCTCRVSYSHRTCRFTEII